MTGRAVKGSRFLLQNYVNDKQEELNKLISSSTTLSSFISEVGKIYWRSPLAEENYREYRNEFLDDTEWSSMKKALLQYWPSMGPQWDGIAIVEGKKGEKGLLLVEAKAHVKEMNSKIKASKESRILIEKTIKEVMEALGSKASIDIWLNEYYQLSNRLAFLYLLNNKLNIPTWLVLVNFVNDGSHKETSLQEWMEHYELVFKKMGIDLSKLNVISIFPDESLIRI